MTQYHFSPDTTGFSLIRFSTTKQADGDSFRRQDSAAEGFCRDEVITLDRSLHEADIRKLGMSALSGRHIIKGPIRKLLAGIEGGTVKPGDVLLVGEWSRLTRQISSDALKFVIDLMERGVGIVDLQDRAYYTLARYNDDMGLQLSLQIKISMSHQYSKNLSHNLTAAWKGRRIAMRAGTGKPTNSCPAWLRAVDGKFVVNAERLAIIDRIKEDRHVGLGKQAIATRLNTVNPVPAFRSAHGWHAASVEKVVKSVALRGIYQPYHADGTPDGEPIEGFYPRVMSDADWWRMQWPEGVKATAGKKSAGVANLLPGVCKCALCGSTLIYLDRGKPKLTGRKRGGTFLICSRARRGLCENRYSHPYPVLEGELLAALSLFDVSAFAQTGNPHMELITATRTQLAASAAILDKLVNDFDTDTPRSVVERIKRLEHEQDALRASLEGMERDAHIAEANEQTDAHAVYKAMIETMATLPLGEERAALRRKIVVELGRMIETVSGDASQLIFTLKSAGTDCHIALVFERARMVELRLIEDTTGDFFAFPRDEFLLPDFAGRFAEHVVQRLAA